MVGLLDTVVPGEVVVLVAGDGVEEFFGVFGDVAVGDGVAFGLREAVFAELGVDGVGFVADLFRDVDFPVNFPSIARLVAVEAYADFVGFVPAEVFGDHGESALRIDAIEQIDGFCVTFGNVGIVKDVIEVVGDVVGKRMIFAGVLGAIHFLDDAMGANGVFAATDRVGFFGGLGWSRGGGSGLGGFLGGLVTVGRLVIGGLVAGGLVAGRVVFERGVHEMWGVGSVGL